MLSADTQITQMESVLTDKLSQKSLSAWQWATITFWMVQSNRTPVHLAIARAYRTLFARASTGDCLVGALVRNAPAGRGLRSARAKGSTAARSKATVSITGLLV